MLDLHENSFLTGLLFMVSTEPCLLEPFKPRMPLACGEGTCAAISPISVRPPPRELPPHVRIPDIAGRAAVWREHGNLCWEKK